MLWCVYDDRWCGLAFLEGSVLYVLCVRWFTGAVTVEGPVVNGGLYDMNGFGFLNNYGQDGGVYMEGFMIFTVLVVFGQYKVSTFLLCNCNIVRYIR